MDRGVHQTAASVVLIIGVATLGVFAQAQAPNFAPGTTAIEALVRVRGAIGAAVEAGDLPQLRAWISLSERGLPGKSVLWLWPNERLLLAFWLGEYEIALALPVAGLPTEDDPRPYLPPVDLLFRHIQEASTSRRDELKEAVRSSGLGEDQRYFLLLLLDYLLKLEPLTHEEQLVLNRAAAYFSRRFPNSQYRDYVVNTIVTPVPLPSQWAVGLDLGAVYTVFFGELQRNFTDDWGVSSGVDVAYRRLVTYLRAQIVLSTTKRQFSSGGNWDSGITVFAVAPELSLGYLLIASRRFKLAPFVGACYLIIVPKSDEMPMQEQRPSLRIPTCNVGLNLDLLLEVFGLGNTSGMPLTKRVLRARAVVGASKNAQNGRLEAKTATLALMFQVFYRPRRK